MLTFLVDTSPKQMSEQKSSLVSGQLITPLTSYKNWLGKFGIDNGAFSGFDRNAWFRLLKRHYEHYDNCLFVAAPDVVGSHIRTIELFNYFKNLDELKLWSEKLCLVAQDGIESSSIDWSQFNAIFIGGTNDFKDSWRAYDLCKAAVAMGKHVHVGRVNAFSRWEVYNNLGAHTCDGSGIAMYSHMLKTLEEKVGLAEKPKGPKQADMFY